MVFRRGGRSRGDVGCVAQAFRPSGPGEDLGRTCVLSRSSDFMLQLLGVFPPVLAAVRHTLPAPPV